MAKRSVGRPPTPPAGVLSQLTADAITLYRRRAGISTHALYESAGMSAAKFYARMGGRLSLSLNDVEALSAVLGVTPHDISLMATKLGEATPAVPTGGTA